MYPMAMNGLPGNSLYGTLGRFNTGAGGRPVLYPAPQPRAPIPFEGTGGGMPGKGAGGFGQFMQRMQALRMGTAMRERLAPRPY